MTNCILFDQLNRNQYNYFSHNNCLLFNAYSTEDIKKILTLCIKQYRVHQLINLIGCFELEVWKIWD